MDGFPDVDPVVDDFVDEALVDPAAALEQQLFGRSDFAASKRRRVEPDWAALARELKRPGVSMMILWEEYNCGAPPMAAKHWI